MQKRALTIAAVAIFGLAGSAIAQDNDPKKYGFVGCVNDFGEADQPPGQLFQDIKAGGFGGTWTGLNPAEIWGPQQGVNGGAGADFPTLGPGASSGGDGALDLGVNCPS